MWRQALLAFFPLAVLVAIPLLLRPSERERSTGPATAGDRLVIVTPHSESVRYEFGRAFREYYRKKFGREVTLEWRTPGGTSDIVRFIADSYEAAFRNAWNADPTNPPWNKTIAANFANPKARPGSGLPDEALAARRKFLASRVGIGIDLMFGGGQFDHQRQADKGYAVDAGMQQRHPDWFTPESMPRQFSGETFYDPAGRYYGACLAAFGLCWNRQRLDAMTDSTPPREWSDLGAPRFFQQIAIADPIKSGSVNKCYEMMIQQQMAAAVKTDPVRGLDQGWANGMNLIKRMAANSRYVTDSASKVPHDVAGGGAAAGICIDSYGRAETQWSALQNHGVSRMVFLCPADGTSVSADPIQLLRGAPNREIAVAFIEFVLSVESQKLWDFRLGTPGGPYQYQLRRMPIRKELYAPEYRQYLADPEVNLYSSCAGFVYRPEWTGKYFGLLRVMIKCIVLNPLPELQEAWREILRAGGPEAVPQAMAAFNRLPFPYHDADAAAQKLQVGKNITIIEVLRLQREWTENAARNYREAAALAREGK